MPGDGELERALVRAIVEADPDDDEPRLVYADYLQGRGDPRGELIAIQCREARAGGDALENRSIALFDDHEARWAGAWHGEPGTWRFRRGFLDELAVPLDTFAVNAQVLFELEALPDELIHVTKLALRQPRGAPPFEELVTRMEPHPVFYAEYMACDAFVHKAAQAIARLRLRALALQLVMSLKFARTIAQPSWAQLSSLAIDSPVIERGAVPAVLEAPLDRLTALRLCCRLRDDDWAAIAQAPRLRPLRSLEVSGDLTTIAPLIRATPSLTTLRVVHGMRGRSMLIDDPAVRGPSMRGDPTLLDVLGEVRPPLVELDISGTWITVDLAPLAKLPTLERLDVHGVPFEDSALPKMLRLPELTALNIAHTRITPAGLERLLVDAPPTLSALTISTPRMPPRLLERLAARFALRRQG